MVVKTKKRALKTKKNMKGGSNKSSKLSKLSKLSKSKSPKPSHSKFHGVVPLSKTNKAQLKAAIKAQHLVKPPNYNPSTEYNKMKQSIYEGLKNSGELSKNNRNKFIKNSIGNLMTLKNASRPNILNLKNPGQTSTNSILNLTGPHKNFGFGTSVINNTERYGFGTNTNPLERRNSIINAIEKESSQYPKNIPSELPPKYELPNKPPDYKIQALNLNSTISSNSNTRKNQFLQFQAESDKLYDQMKLEELDFERNMAQEGMRLLKTENYDLYEAHIQKISDFVSELQGRKNALKKRQDAFENYDKQYAVQNYKHLQSPLPPRYSSKNSILPVYTP